MYQYPYLYLYLVILGDGLKRWVVRPMGYLRGGLSGPWDTEEVGCQACGILKRRVVSPMRNFSLGERIVGN
jgi:hypothetical protein